MNKDGFYDGKNIWPIVVAGLALLCVGIAGLMLLLRGLTWLVTRLVS
jgi:hypothetical protein